MSDSKMPPKKLAGKNNVIEEGLETKLWKAADKLRNNMDAAEYKHIVLELIFRHYSRSVALSACRFAFYEPYNSWHLFHLMRWKAEYQRLLKSEEFAYPQNVEKHFVDFQKKSSGLGTF